MVIPVHGVQPTPKTVPVIIMPSSFEEALAKLARANKRLEQLKSLENILVRSIRLMPQFNTEVRALTRRAEKIMRLIYTDPDVAEMTIKEELIPWIAKLERNQAALMAKMAMHPPKKKKLHRRRPYLYDPLFDEPDLAHEFG